MQTCIGIVYVLVTLSVFRLTDAIVCCAPDQWEGHMYLDYQQVFIDRNTLYLYNNGSVRVAYDYTNSRAYYSVIGTEMSFLLPRPMSVNTTTIIDYKQNVQYTINRNGACEKSDVDQNMTKQCIGDDGILQRRSRVGSHLAADTYIMSLSENLNNVRATVQRGTCLPIHMVYYIGSVNPDSGAVFTLDVLGIKPTITDPSVFTPPPSCRHAKTQDKHGKQDRFQILLWHIFHKRMLFG